jgi:geranylgeranyl pyrophosphate synthase
MEYRDLVIRLPGDLPDDRYASITHTVFSILDALELAEVSSLLVDDVITDADLNRHFDLHNQRYAWGDS